MFTRIKLKRKINKIFEKHFKDTYPSFYVKRHNLGFEIVCFRDNPKLPDKEAMKLILELGLNKNLRHSKTDLGINGFGYLYLIIDTQYDSNRSGVDISSNFRVGLDSITSINMIKSPHMLINGATGTGKTYLLSYLMCCYKMLGSELIVIDGKNTDLEVIGIILNERNLKYSNSTEKIKSVHESLLSRQSKVKVDISKDPSSLLGKNFLDHNLQPIILVIDEYKSFIDSLSKTTKIDGQSEQKYYEYLIQDIVAKGRSLGIFVILASQRFSTDTLKNDIRSNFGVIISLGNEKQETNLMLFGQANVPIVKLGGGVIKSNEEFDVVEFKAPYIADLQKFISMYT